MDEIVTSVQRVTDIMAEISQRQPGAERAASSRSTAPSAQMDEMTQQNAALVEQAGRRRSRCIPRPTTWRALVNIFQLEQPASGGRYLAAA